MTLPHTYNVIASTITYTINKYPTHKTGGHLGGGKGCKLKQTRFQFHPCSAICLTISFYFLTVMPVSCIFLKFSQYLLSRLKFYIVFMQEQTSAPAKMSANEVPQKGIC